MIRFAAVADPETHSYTLKSLQAIMKDDPSGVGATFQTGGKVRDFDNKKSGYYETGRG